MRRTRTNRILEKISIESKLYGSMVRASSQQVRASCNSRRTKADVHREGRASSDLLLFHRLWLAVEEYTLNSESQSELVLCICRRRALVCATRRNIEHRTHFGSSASVNRGYATRATSNIGKNLSDASENLLFAVDQCDEIFPG